MTEGLPSPLPSDASSGGVKRRTTVGEDQRCHLHRHHSNQQPILALCLAPSPANLETAIDGVQENHFPQEKSYTSSPKNPKLSPRSENLPPLTQGAVEDEKKENPARSSILEKGTQLLLGKYELVQACDGSLNLDTGDDEFARPEWEKMNGNCDRNEAIVEELDVSTRNCSEKQSVVDLVASRKVIPQNQPFANEVRKAKEISKRLRPEQKNEGFLHKLVKSHFEGSNAAGLISSVKVEVVDETALFDFSALGRKTGQRRGRKINSNGKRRRSVYSRTEMVALRFMNVKGQKKFWQQIYYSFPGIVKREYDELDTSRQHHKPGKRYQNPGMRNYYSQGILGMCSVHLIFNCSLSWINFWP